jgi:hypothetical protein
VSITSPANGATFTAPANVIINANASDNGTVAKVEFFNGAAKLGEDSSSPYSFTWTNVTAGSYALTARATDNLNASTTSATVNITISGTSGGCTGIAQYVENGGYVAGSLVQNVGSQYECKPYPYSGWCNGAAWAYAPGTGTYWTDAWTLKGSCAGGAGARIATQGAALETNDEDKGLAVYPNPGERGQRSITLSFENNPGRVNIHLKDINGAEVFSIGYAEVRNKELNIDIPPLPDGLYLIRVQGERKAWVRKYLVH